MAVAPTIEAHLPAPESLAAITTGSMAPGGNVFRKGIVTDF
jgi:hypothetical protein